MFKHKKTTYNVAIAIALFVSVAIATYSLYLFFVGHGTTIFAEGSTLRSRGHFPSPAAIYPLTGSVLIAFGLLIAKRWISWIGLVVLSVFSSLFVFGIGGMFVPLCALLIVLLSVIQFSAT